MQMTLLLYQVSLAIEHRLPDGMTDIVASYYDRIAKERLI
jgi:hypothetical protein